MWKKNFSSFDVNISKGMTFLNLGVVPTSSFISLETWRPDLLVRVCLAAMLTARPWNNIVDPNLDSLDLPDTEAERLKLKQYAAYYAVGMCMPAPSCILGESKGGV